MASSEKVCVSKPGNFGPASSFKWQIVFISSHPINSCHVPVPSIPSLDTQVFTWCMMRSAFRTNILTHDIGDTSPFANDKDACVICPRYHQFNIGRQNSAWVKEIFPDTRSSKQKKSLLWLKEKKYRNLITMNQKFSHFPTACIPY